MDQHPPSVRAYRIFMIAYYILCGAMTAVYGIKGDLYHLFISAGTLVVPPALGLAYRLLRLKRCENLDLLIMGFVTLSYPLGACIDLYRRIPGFDKLAHGLSGVFVTVLCVILFMLLKPDHTLTSADVPLGIAFAFAGSMAVAGMWEIGEYLLSGVVRLDLQRVMATGVADSMNDMLICMAGTLVTLPVIPHLAKGRTGPLSSSIREFVALNA